MTYGPPLYTILRQGYIVFISLDDHAVFFNYAVGNKGILRQRGKKTFLVGPQLIPCQSKRPKITTRNSNHLQSIGRYIN